MKNILKSATALLLLAVFATACEKKADVFTREQDEVTASCLEQSIEQNILCSGDWSASADSDWITVTPESGTGNGVDYQYYYINVAYNKGAGRSGNVYLTHNGVEYQVLVNQKKCSFAYGKASFDGTLRVDEASTAQVKIAYVDAGGDESAKISGTITGAGAAGLQFKDQTFTSFAKGNGFAVAQITGTPVSAGKITIAVSVDGKAVGTVTATVEEKKAEEPGEGEGGQEGEFTDPVEGLPCGWNFYALGLTETAPTTTEAGKDWVGADAPHVVYPTSGSNAGATLSAVGAAITSYNFNPGIQVQGFAAGDYLLATIPVKNVSSTTKITVESATGGAKGSVGFYVLEYSSDGETWYEADGIQSITRGEDVVKAHFWNTYASINGNGTVCTDGSIGNRKSYDKSSEYETYHAYSFPLSNIRIADGILYLRMRVLEWGATQDKLVAVKAGWTDIKGFEVSLSE